MGFVQHLLHNWFATTDYSGDVCVICVAVMYKI